MNKLKNMACYLIGPIDRAKDDGVQWRKELRSKSVQNGLGIKFLDPTDKPEHIGQEIGEEKHKIKRLMEEGKFAEAKQIVTKIRHYDLRMVDTSHFVIALIDTDLHLCGSYDELFTAERQQKPILILMKQQKKDIPAWLISFIHPEEIFESIDSLVSYLSALNNGSVVMDNRWINFEEPEYVNTASVEIRKKIELTRNKIEQILSKKEFEV